MRIEYSDSIVKWNNGYRNVEYRIERVEYASVEDNIICIETYSGNELEYHFVDKDGKFILSYNEVREEIVLADLYGVKKNILIPQIKEVVIDSNKRFLYYLEIMKVE